MPTARDRIVDVRSRDGLRHEGAETPVQNRCRVGVDAVCVDERPQIQDATTLGEGFSGLDVQVAGEGVALVHRPV